MQTDDYYIHYNSDSPQSILVDDLFAYLKIKGYQFKNLKNLTKLSRDLIKNRDFIGLEKLENYEFNLDKKNQNKIGPADIKKEIINIEKKLSELKKPIDQVVLTEIVKRLEIIKKPNYKNSEILIESIEELLKIVNK